MQRHPSLGPSPPLGLLLGWCGPLAVELVVVVNDPPVHHKFLLDEGLSVLPSRLE